MDVCQKKKRGAVSSLTYIICDPLYENRTYEAISNFEKGAKINFASNMASRTTVSIKPFASTRCFLVCQQNLVVDLYYRTDFGRFCSFSIGDREVVNS